MLKKSERTQLFPGNCLDESDIQCLSKNVIQFNLKHILTDFIHILSIQEASIIAKCLLKNQEEMQTKAIGTGPFILECIDRKEEKVELVKNKKYWDKPPYFDKIDIWVEKSYKKRKKLIYLWGSTAVRQTRILHCG